LVLFQKAEKGYSVDKKDRQRFQRGSDDLEQLEGIEKQQQRSRKAAKHKRQGKKKSKHYPLVDSLEKSRRRVKNRFGRIKKPGDAIDEFGS
jgi:hypothetical protein